MAERKRPVVRFRPSQQTTNFDIARESGFGIEPGANAGKDSSLVKQVAFGSHTYNPFPDIGRIIKNVISYDPWKKK
jgi:hypothetical protein